MRHQQRLSVVTLGGGTGHSVVLGGLKDHDLEITAIVAVTDDGGSSGRLRDQFGAAPPGDIRQCLLALAPEEIAPVLRNLLAYRFEDGQELKGHSFGNLFLVALEQVTGSLPRAIETAGSILGIRGRVLPVSLGNTRLQALLNDGSRITGESRIDLRGYQPNTQITQVSLDPPAAAYPPALDAIQNADLIVLGPGDLYTSLLPVVLVEGVAEAVNHRRGFLVYVSNLMTKPGETDGFHASDFLREVHRYLGGSVDVILASSNPVPDELVRVYAAEGALPVELDVSACEALGVQVARAPMLAPGILARHDSQTVARALVEIASNRRAGLLATSKSGTHWEPRDQGLDGGLVSSLRALL